MSIHEKYYMQYLYAIVVCLCHLHTMAFFLYFFVRCQCVTSAPVYHFYMPLPSLHYTLICRLLSFVFDLLRSMRALWRAHTRANRTIIYEGEMRPRHDLSQIELSERRQSRPCISLSVAVHTGYIRYVAHYVTS